ncbi:response regulator, partial [candidate division KSB1 bacterium]|nr:response regulator [candidate division KSB1 bacterium]
LSDNFVRAIFEDSRGILWIGTRSGLSQFDREHGIFIPFRMVPGDSNSALFDENVTKLLEDSAHNLWIGTPNSIFIYDRNNHKVEHFSFDGRAERVTDIFQDSYGAIWIGTRYNGLLHYDLSTTNLRRYQHHRKDGGSIRSNEIKAIFEDANKNLWVGTIHGGLALFVREEDGFYHYENDPNDPSSLSSNSVRAIYQDRTGVIWIGMDGSGIDSFVKNRRKFPLYRNRSGEVNAIGNFTILSIYKDHEGILWIGTEGGGLYRMNRNTGEIENYRSRRNQSVTLSNDHVTCIYQDKEGTLWCGTKEGLNKYEEQRHSFTRYYVRLTPITGNNVINVIKEDHRGRLILATNGGILLFDKNRGEFAHVDWDAANLLNNEVVVTLWIDPDGTMWLGYLRSGLVAYDSKNQTAVHYHADAASSNSLSSNFVQYVYRSKAGHLWIATRNGLNLFNPSEDVFKLYTKTDGLPSNVVVGILEDREGDLWLSTTNGLSRFNPVEETFTNYDIDDGLQGNQFWIRSCFSSSSHELFFGGNNGFNCFLPANIKAMANPHIPPIVITSVKIGDGPVVQNLSALVAADELLNLSHRDNQISFEFAALDYTRPEKNQYAYKLEGLNDEWIYAGTRRYVNYTNLAPGHYIFRVRGTNNDGVWNEEGAHLRIFIATPFYKTWWAYLLYAAAAVAFLYGVNAYVIGLVRIKHDLKIERMEKEKEKELSQFKLQFFTDIAHEFKTPLTLIQAPLEEILARVKKGGRYEQEYRLMQRNVKYLLRLVHQLLSFRRAEQGHLQLKVSRGDVVQFVREVHELFRDSAKKHQIDYLFSSNPDRIEGWFDWEKVEEIVVNLLDNAFKFTPDRGKINVMVEQGRADKGGGTVRICVTDTGMGVPEDKRNQIFDRFYHGKPGLHPNQVGSGLGLALSKRLAELHHGTITVQSDEGKGSCFTVTLPLGKSHLRPEEIISDISETHHFQSLLQLPVKESLSARRQGVSWSSQPAKSDKPLVLVVEDDDELRAYMRKTLSGSYRIVEAGDGREGLEMAGKFIPHIIISDVMMPHLDGIELCRLIKDDLVTSHIPVILLTAQDALEYKIEGMETGADDYIEKPFHFRFLDARIKNILKTREMLRQQVQRELLLEPTGVPVVSADEKFLEKIKSIVEEKLSDAELDVQHLSSAIGISRTMLFVKLKELTGYSPKEFIRILRLKKGAQFLKNTDYTIAEIAYQVGFKYPKYFSTSFQQQFGKTPTEYRA